MQFQPIGERHAVQEVVFTVGLARHLTGVDFNKVSMNRALWKAELPNDGQVTAFGFQIGSPISNFELPTPLQFNAFKRDGSIDWRLSINPDHIAVNCLTYTRWDEIWARALRYISSVMAVIGDPNLSIVGGALQYIDAFNWMGPAGQVDIAELIQRGGPLVNDQIFESGPLWHLHQGFYNPPVAEVPGAILTRINIDTLPPAPTVKIDTFLRHEYPEPRRPQAPFYEKGGDLDVLFRKLHVMDKELMMKLLTPAATARIALNA